MPQWFRAFFLNLQHQLKTKWGCFAQSGFWQLSFVRATFSKVLLGLVFVLIVGYGALHLYLISRGAHANLKDGYYSAAFDRYYSKASGGNAEAQNIIGNLYYLGLGVRQDRYSAARWYLKAALGGYVPAQINLGQMYFNGLGVPRRVANAVGWFHLAKKAGSERAEEHMKYIGKTNISLPLMFDQAVLKFENLNKVQNRFKEIGEAAFLLE